MVQIAIVGGPPDSAAEAFRALQQNKLLGLLRLDFATVLVLPLYYLFSLVSLRLSEIRIARTQRLGRSWSSLV
jgi:hypothetical protein